MQIKTALGAGALAALMALSMTACGAASTNPYANGGQYYAGNNGRIASGSGNDRASGSTSIGAGNDGAIDSVNTPEYIQGNGSIDGENGTAAGKVTADRNAVGAGTAAGRAGNAAVNTGRAAGNNLRSAADNIVDGVTDTRSNTNLEPATSGMDGVGREWNNIVGTNGNNAVARPLS